MKSMYERDATLAETCAGCMHGALVPLCGHCIHKTNLSDESPCDACAWADHHVCNLCKDLALYAPIIAPDIERPAP